MTYFWLNFHLSYACRHSGACCSSGWPIPVERRRVIPIRSLAARADDTWLVPAADSPDDVAGTLAVRPNGECTFFRIPTSIALLTGVSLPTSVAGSLPASSGVPPSAGCAVHPARPSSCSHFPFACLIDARGVHVTLSHYCPTAASMLFANEAEIKVVEGPSPVAGFDIPEGLDARESLPPAFAEASAGRARAAKVRLMSWHEFSEWERVEVVKEVAAPSMAAAVALFEHARQAVPAPWSWPVAPLDLEGRWASMVAPAWPRFASVVQRYRAAKVFASWAVYTGDGLAAVLRGAEIAGAVLLVEAVRQCEAADRLLDAGLLLQAIRQSDLLLVHYADGWVLSSGITP